MKKFIFGIIALVVAGAIWVLSKENSCSSESAQNEGEMIPRVDSKKTNLKEAKTTFEMMESLEWIYKDVTKKVAEDTKRVLGSDSGFIKEVEAWEEVYNLLNEFCVDAVHIGWYGGSGCSLMMRAMRGDVLDIRAKDLSRIIQLNGGKDPASNEMVEYKRKELCRILDLASETLIPPEWLREIPEEGIDEYKKLYNRTQKDYKLLPAAIEKWIATRDTRYNGCTAITLDDMKDAVNVTLYIYEEE